MGCRYFTVTELHFLNPKYQAKVIENIHFSSLDARKRDELQQLKEYMRRRPLEFRIWRILRVDASLPLNAVMQSVNLLILMLQFKNSDVEIDYSSHNINSTQG